MFKRNKEKKIFLRIANITTAVILVFVIFSLIYFFSQLTFKKTMTVADQEINIEVVKTIEDKKRGLSGRKDLDENNGMLFMYENYNIPTFWMKDMYFSIDIIWIKDDMVVGYDKDLQLPINGEDLSLYRPKSFVNYVLEVNSGFVDKYGIKIGDEVRFDR